jgi:hypothetical protein
MILVSGIETWVPLLYYVPILRVILVWPEFRFPEISYTIMRHEMTSLDISPSGSELLLVQSSGKEYSMIRVGIQSKPSVTKLGQVLMQNLNPHLFRCFPKPCCQANQNFDTFISAKI